MGKNLLLWLIIAAVLLTVFNNFNVKPEPESLSYSNFIADVRSDEIQRVTIGEQVIRGSKRSGDEFQVVRPPGLNDQKLIDDLYNHSVEIVGKMPDQQSIWAQLLIASFPILIIIAVFMLFSPPGPKRAPSFSATFASSIKNLNASPSILASRQSSQAK